MQLTTVLFSYETGFTQPASRCDRLYVILSVADRSQTKFIVSRG
ncbi:hypothetical protein Q5692_17105 [Microcoleus sp. C2C3]